ncbi:ATP-binding protein [Streptomyces sp. NPDC005500]|uniref:ATP-binding protein n=1 Tax=Streptomyces sp. NPDC005500 TaxID=3155007 RepID=UPI0033A58011
MTTCTYVDAELDSLLEQWPEQPTETVAAVATLPACAAPDGPCALPHDSTAPATARGITHTLLDAQLPDTVIDEALLVISELVTNAVEHALPPISLQIRHDQDEHRVTVEVTDGGPAAHDGPWTTSIESHEHGRGLAVVNALTANHGTRPTTKGTTHWAHLNTT